jgi:hypothetical protein
MRIPWGTKVIVCVPCCPFGYFCGVSERAAQTTLAIVEPPVVYGIHILAPYPLLYAINQAQFRTHNHIMQRVPSE